ncbi:hypothetical protein DFP72DRAFT_1043541 [Ephemerocybe angulata]|uniref:DUF6593 domain-containing protein n=1 Tax=Ephemerocybe angulata TaxID=980116 RepID=A0A8H6MBW1_9AGAR|nr:hypothetical protein DFP72DRAFT_1043541 [Tulosesus angulatus]
MSHSSNPYAQGGWSNPSNPNSAAPEYWQGAMPHAPTFGALPSASVAASPSLVTFQFNSYNGDTLNSTVTDSNQQMYFNISTAPGPIKVTTFSTADGMPFATVEWSSPPLVTIKSLVPRQDATKWLLFSRDRGTAALGVGPQCFLWVFQGSSIYLYRSESNPPERLAKLYRRDSLYFDVNVSALRNSSSLEVFIVAAALLQSSRPM